MLAILLLVLIAGTVGEKKGPADRDKVHMKARIVERGRAAEVLDATGKETHWVVKGRGDLQGVGDELERRFGGEAMYVPYNSYVVFGSRGEVARFMAEVPWAIWFDALQPGDKHDSGMEPAATLMVHVSPRTSESLVTTWATAIGCTSTLISPKLYKLATCPPTHASIRYLTNQNHVHFVHPQETPSVFMTEIRGVVETGVPGVATASAKGISGAGEVVAIGDTGLDHEVCHFIDHREPVSYYPNTSATHRKIVAISQSDCECTERGATTDGLSAPYGDTTDHVDGHGTHAAGCLVGDDLATGSTPGMVPKAKLFFQDLQDPYLSTFSLKKIFPGHQLTAKYYKEALAAGARVHSSSWGTSPITGPDDAWGAGGYGPRVEAAYNLHARDTDTWGWQHKEYTMVFSAGNDGRRGARTISSPGNAKNVITVGTQDGIVPGKGTVSQDVSDFSSTGPAFDGRTKPDVVAPGVAVRSAYSNGFMYKEECQTTLHSGGSVSTPIAAGCAVLLRQFLREGWLSGVMDGYGAIQVPRSDLIKALLIASGDVIHGKKSLDFNDPVGEALNKTWPSRIAGYGLVNLQNVMVFDKPMVPQYDMWFDTTGVFTTHASNARYTWCFSVLNVVDKTKPLRVILAWVDYPATLFSSIALVTDLDLILFNDVGQTWKGNQDLFTNTDHLNNVEGINVQNPLPGNYQLHVVLRTSMIDAVRRSGQPFSIVVTGPVTKNLFTACPVQFCPNSCSGNGDCMSTLEQVDVATVPVRNCQCAAGYQHADCSIPSCSAAVECTFHGCYDAATQKCSCFEDYLNGFWTGSKCELCKNTHVGMNATGSLTCDVDRSCSYHGTFTSTGPSAGFCQCQSTSATGWWGGKSCRTCADGYYGLTCRCGDPYCDGHGVCTDSGCKCDDDDTEGHWGSFTLFRDCSVCKQGWYGIDCKCRNATCHGHGECRRGGCVCDSSQARGHWQLSQYSCATCQPGWAGPACNCRIEGSVVCGGHGTCDTAAGCACYQSSIFGWWRSSAEGLCNTCSTGYGPGCRCKDSSCSGHGTCTTEGCVCDDSKSAGHWQQIDNTCDTCKDGWYGKGCRCMSRDCDGHGVCEELGCTCNASPVLGYFAGDGTHCKSCMTGWAFYPYCLCDTPTCNGHGVCSLTGCSCDTAWASTDPDATPNCATCAADYAGIDCSCSADNCLQATSSGQAFTASGTLHEYDTGNLTYTTTVQLMADAQALTPPGTGINLMLKKVDDTDKTHPRRSGPLNTVFLECSFVFSFTVTYGLEVGATPSPTIQGNDSVGNGTAGRGYEVLQSEQAPASIQFVSYLTVETTWVHTPEKLPVDTRTVRLMVLDGSGWKDAHKTCPQETQLRELDAGSKLVTTRVCSVANNAVFAVYGDVYSSTSVLTTVLSTVGGLLLVIIVCALILYKLRKHAIAERKAREAKDLIIQFMQHRKDEGPGLREKLGLGPDDDFTEEMAAQVLLRKLEKRRRMFKMLMGRKEFRQIQMLTRAMAGVELTGSSQQNIDALSRITHSGKDLKKIWEFQEEELHLLEACRLVRGAFQGGVLKGNALPDLHQELVETKAENVKLRRILQALKKREANPTIVPNLNPKQQVPPPAPHQPEKIASLKGQLPPRIQGLDVSKQNTLSPLGASGSHDSASLSPLRVSETHDGNSACPSVPDNE